MLPELDAPLPPGTYDVDTDEEVIEGNERTVYLRIATVIYVRGVGSIRTVTINPSVLAAVLQRDAGHRG
jgi:hypothetical protein